MMITIYVFFFSFDGFDYFRFLFTAVILCMYSDREDRNDFGFVISLNNSMGVHFIY